ncbi:phosphatase PAP2 family protein [Kroppenstedtia sanguinis]|uniref:Phosphatase PAP2 family protein n=1 Tax=Kroppenstedtia sanguinis TaxID=1380684 RepID=A0ABW4CCF3_9BACL
MAHPIRRHAPLVIGLFLVISVSFLLVNLFVYLAEEMMTGATLRFDQEILLQVASLRSPGVTFWIRGVTELGSIGWLILGTGVGTLLLIQRKQLGDGILFTLGMLGTSGMNTALKNAYERIRPEENPLLHVAGYSFPSGHAMGAIVFYGFLLYFSLKSRFPPWAKVVYGLVWSALILLIGFSRIYLGVHYPSDVLAGWTAGLAILIPLLTVREGIMYWKQRQDR